MCSGEWADNTQSVWPVVFYSQLGAYSQTNTHTNFLLIYTYLTQFIYQMKSPCAPNISTRLLYPKA